MIRNNKDQKKQAVFSSKAPAPVGSYSQAIALGPWLFLSGQIALDPTTNKLISGDIKQQTQRVMQSIHAILEAHQMNFSHVVKVGIFLKDMQDFSKVDQVYSSFFKKPFPARSCVAVKELPKSVDIEIEMQAFCRN